MKKIFKLFLPLLLLFVFSTNIYAEDFVCNNGDYVTIKEVSEAEPFGFDTYLPVCKWVKVKPDAWNTFKGKNLEAAKTEATKKYNTTVRATDEKSIGSTQVSICDLKESKASVYGSCDYSKKIDFGYINGYKKDGKCTQSYVQGADKCQIPICEGSIVNGNCIKSGTYYTSIDNLTIEQAEAITTDDIKAKFTDKTYYDNITSCKITRYEIKCPIYKCDVDKKRINACTPRFETEDKKTAYCVNPNQPFSKTGKKTAQYIEDPNFDVNKCENSFNTVDCGYANILIEAGYANQKTNNKVCDNAVNLALRLWGVHTNQKGYDLTGLSRRTGSDCSQEALFIELEDGSVINVYRETHNYIMKNFEAKARTFEYIEPTGKHFDKITCSADLLGVICAPDNDTKCGGRSTYQKAFDLYFNTLIGNKYMKEHLRALYSKDGMDTTPTDATIIDAGGGKSVIEVRFSKLTEMTERGVVVDCSKLKPGDANFDEIDPFCKVKVSIVDANGEPIVDEIKLKECIKGDGCSTVEFKYAVCDEIKKLKENVVIRTEYEPTVASKSIKKYYPCEDPESNQFLFGYYDEKTLEDIEKQEGKTTTTETVVQDFPLTTYSCGGACTDYNIREVGNKNCSKDSAYDTTYKYALKDPSLSCIVNMAAASEKEHYDYTSYFGLNSNICRVYCSDEIEFTLPNKKLINSGLSFKYDIKFNNLSENVNTLPFTSVVEEKRRCVSEIYYSKNFPTASKTSIQRKYGFTDNEMKDINNWTSLFEALSKKAYSEGERKENLIEMIYDLYNCNIFAGDIPVDKPKNRTLGNIYKYIKSLYSDKNNYGIGLGDNSYHSCDLSDDKNTCINLDSINYQGGAEVYGKVGEKEENITRVGKNESIDKDYKVSSYNIDKNGVKYCSGSCLSYDSNKEEKYDLNNFTAKFNSDIISRSVTGNKISSVNNIIIPTNDYAYFELATQVGVYNNSKFDTHPYTGYVSKRIEDSNLIALDNYIYPMSKNAYSLCSGSGNIHNCTVTQNYGTIKTYYRKTNDRLTSMLDANKSFGCYIDVKPPRVVECIGKCDGSSSLGYAIYRNVDISNLFPSGRENVSSNWTTEKGQKAIEEIQESSQYINNSDLYLEYSIELTPEQIKAYRANVNSGYQNNTILENTCKKEGNLYLNCQSSFMDDLRNNSKSNNYSYGKLFEEYSTGVSKHTKKIEN